MRTVNLSTEREIERKREKRKRERSKSSKLIWTQYKNIKYINKFINDPD